ncbi:hypothetical protein LO772_11565 [Yinghuangia sp. ASG 101]|uniref:hypothetical protein n=1 Tax=Yinghuangia sp. ASG 101 TaxID=2896848 RepID=UPI001E54971F|nr:hypothetical protein [Yinghuangia sp. ASG 101]UGQ14171.1 hypothetical protein LO772_11565 [Yinghuangia sp. ASG 101]
MSRDEVADAARPIVDYVGDVLGADRVPVWRGIVGAPVERPDGTLDTDVHAYTVGAQVMDVPVAEHAALVRRLRDTVVKQHWEVRDFRVREDTGTAFLVCVHPGTGFDVAVGSTHPATALAVLIETPAIAVPPRDEGPGIPTAPHSLDSLDRIRDILG